MKLSSIIIRIAVTVLACGLGVFVLEHYEYISQFQSLDNIVGMIPVVLVLIAVAGIVVLAWMPLKKGSRVLAISMIVLVILSVALFPNSLRSNWWINPKTSSQGEASPDLSLYAPFTGTSTARLGEPSTLVLKESLPKLDGATALYPVYSSIAEAVYDRGTLQDSDVVCRKTGGAYEALIHGEADIIFVASASEGQMAAAKQAGVELEFTPIGREAFVFIVGQGNPTDNLSTQELKNIMSGKTRHWSTLGWDDGGSILVFQRPEDSGSQTGLNEYIGTQIPIAVPSPLPDPSLIGSGSLMQEISVEWQGVQPALGYSYRYFATTMYANPKAKILSVDGISPSTETIRSGEYPFSGDFFAVTRGTPTGTTKELIDWILSPQGQTLIEKTGYVPIAPTQ